MRGFVLVVGDFLDFVDEDGAGEPLVFGVHVGGSLDDGAADLVLEVGKVAAPLTPLVLSKTSWTFLVSAIVVKLIFIKLIFNPIRSHLDMTLS
jgi:hypothetical protein